MLKTFILKSKRLSRCKWFCHRSAALCITGCLTLFAISIIWEHDRVQTVTKVIKESDANNLFTEFGNQPSTFDYDPSADIDYESELLITSYTPDIPALSGDSIPDEQPWLLPDITVHENILNFTDHLLTSNFFRPGFGNLLFTYATLYAASRIYSMRLVFPEGLLLRRSFYLGGDENSTEIYVSNKLQEKLQVEWRHYSFDCCRFDPEVLQLNKTVTNDNLSLIGLFQSYKYFWNYTMEIRSKLKFLDFIQMAARETIEEALMSKQRKRENTILIGVHVRRGLELRFNIVNKISGHVVAPKSYYFTAMNFYRRRFNNDSHSVLFLVSSDDSSWCKKNLLQANPINRMKNDENVNNERNDIVIIATDLSTREVDFAVLANCQHLVMSTGTFSWWAAFLSGGEAIYYDGWPRRDSILFDKVERNDYFLPEWKAMK